jgi:hypothetical protein
MEFGRILLISNGGEMQAIIGQYDSLTAIFLEYP